MTTQIFREIAKDSISMDFKNGAACTYMTSIMREAIVDARCFNAFRHMDTMVSPAAMDEMRTGVRAAICAKFGIGFFDP